MIEESIVLVHGIGSSNLVMLPLTLRLKALGYRVVPFSYPTFFRSIQSHALSLKARLLQEVAQSTRLHVVAHSMGAIVTRTALAQMNQAILGRIVLLAPPNRGSPIARYASYIVGRLSPPTRELSDVESSFVNQLPNIDGIDMGIIAAEHDWLVPLSSTSLPQKPCTRSERVVMSETHNSLLFSTSVVNMIDRYLQRGTFRASSSKP